MRTESEIKVRINDHTRLRKAARAKRQQFVNLNDWNAAQSLTVVAHECTKQIEELEWMLEEGE